MYEITPRVSELIRLHVSDEYRDTSIVPTTVLTDIGIDSLGKVSLMIAIEEKFHVEFEADMLQDETFYSVGSVLQALELLGVSDAHEEGSTPRGEC